MGARGLAIRSEISAEELRRLARREVRPSASARMYAIANALAGLSRAEAARLAGMERQALRDAVVRYNVEGLAGLQDRPRPGPKPRLDAAERKALSELILKGPDVEASGLSAWTLPELCREVEQRWGKHFHPASLSRVVRRLGFSRQKAARSIRKATRRRKRPSKKGAPRGRAGGPCGPSGQAPDAVVSR